MTPHQLLRKLIYLSFAGICIFYTTYIIHIAQFAQQKDFSRFYSSAVLFWQQQPIYNATAIQIPDKNYPQHINTIWNKANLGTPFFMVLAIPLALVKIKIAFIIWNYLGLLAMLASLMIILQEYRLFNNVALACLSLTLCLASYPVYLNLFFGQVGLFLFLFLVLLWRNIKHDQYLYAGFWLGMSCLIKPFFGLFFILFLLQKNWRLLTAASITLSSGIFISLVVFGKLIYLDYLQVVQQSHWYSSSLNFSLYAYVGRLFGLHESNAVWFNYPNLTINIYVLGTLILLLGLYKISQYHSDRRKQDFAIAYTCIAMLLITPLSWQYYFILLILPCLIILHDFMTKSYSPALMLLLLLAILLLNTPAANLRPFEIKADYLLFTEFGYSFYALIILAILTYKLAYSPSNNKSVKQLTNI